MNVDQSCGSYGRILNEINMIYIVTLATVYKIQLQVI